MRCLTRGGQIVEIVALAETAGFRRVHVLGGDVAPAKVITRLRTSVIGHYAVAEFVVRHRDVEPPFRRPASTMSSSDALRAQIFFQGKALRRRIAQAELQPRRRRYRAVGKIAARLGAMARGQRIGEEFGSQFHHVVERLAALLVLCGIRLRRGNAPGCHRRQPLDRLGEADAFGLHQKRDDARLPEEKS